MNTEEKKLTGYPSIDKPWLKYYSEEAINAELPNCSLYEYLWENNKGYLNEYALNYFGRKITYRELFENIDVVAKAFVAQGVKAGDVCTVVSLSCVTSVLCFYALNKIGAVPNYVNVLASEEELQKYFSEAESGLVVTLDLFGEKVAHAATKAGVKKVVVYSLAEWMPLPIKLGFICKMRKVDKEFLHDDEVMEWKDFVSSAKRIKGDVTCKKDANSLGLLAHTGGTTGFPKSVILSDNALNAVACQYGLGIELKRKSIYLNLLPPFVVYGLGVCLHMPLCLGLCTVLIPKFDSKDWKSYFVKYKPNYILAVPAYVAPILEDKAIDRMNLSYIRALGVGGDGMNEELECNVNEFLLKHGSSAKLLKGYGMTEVCATAVVDSMQYSKVGAVGVPLVKNNVKIYDNEVHKELKYGEVGEICLACPSLMIGYKENEEEMKALVRRHSDGKLWVHTGDLGYIDKDGFLFVKGRMKRFIMVIREGTLYKIFPINIEEIIRKAEYVQDVCVVGTKQGADIVTKAFLVLKEGYQKSSVLEDLKIRCTEELPDYMRPQYYEFLDELPLTAAGKVDYKALEEKES